MGEEVRAGNDRSGSHVVERISILKTECKLGAASDAG
jgi:hypothetical protein